MRRLPLLWFLVLFGLRVAAQNCPAVNFRGASQVDLVQPGQVVSGLERLADGSFTLHTYSYSGATETQTSTTPQFQSNFLSCSGRAAQPVVPPANWTFLGDRLAGAMPRNPAVANLLNNAATPVGLCLQVCNPNVSRMVMATSTSGFNLAAPVYGVNNLAASQIITADVNNDGLGDAIILDTYTPALDVFLMQTTGTLATTPIKTPLPAGAWSFTAADVDRDGKIDVVVTNNQANTITVLLGKGDGTFTAQPAINTASEPGNVVAADVNGDSKLDLVVALPHAIAVYFGKGDGTFQVPQTYSAPGELDAIAVADLNKDGKPDVVAVDSTHGVAIVLLNSGTGAFPNATSYLVGAEGYADSYEVFLMDFDWDGNVDIVFGAGHPDSLMPRAYDHSVTVLFGNGDGSFYGTPAYQLGSYGSIAGGLAVADFTGDGKLDAVAGSSSALTLFKGNGDGTFTPQSSLSQQGSTSVAAGDFNHDGKMDVVATGTAGISVYLGAGGGTFQTARQISTSSSGLTGAAVGDFDGDGNLDFAVVDSLGGTSATASVYLGDGHGNFQSPRTVTVGSGPQHLQAIDVNGDGKLDLVVTNYGTGDSDADRGSVAILLGNGDGSFQPAVQYIAGYNPIFALAADINSDGQPDLITATKVDPVAFTYGLSVRLNQGHGVFGAAQSFGSDYDPTEVAAADLNGDGKVDLLLGHCCGTTQMGYFLGNGDGSFQPEVLMPALSSPVDVKVADLNSDGKPDAVFTSFGPFLAGAINLSTPPTAITIQTVPTGLQVSVDGGAAQAAPATLNLAQGTHTIAVATPQTGTPAVAGTQYAFSAWSDGGAASHSVTVGSSAATFTATFTTQYQLTISASPAAGGTVIPASGGFYDAGTRVPINGIPNTGYEFSSWSGPVDGPPTIGPIDVAMNGPVTLTANFAALTPVTIQTNPAGLLFSISGGAAQTGPQTIYLPPGQYLLAVQSTQPGATGTQYVFTGWNDQGAASHVITVGSTAATYTASFKTQYQLTTSASPAAAGAVTPTGGGFYDTGASVSLNATANSGYQFSSWSGPVAASNSAATTVTMNAAETVTANFVALAGITIQTNPTGLLFSVDGGALQTAPAVLNLSQGNHTVAVATTQAGGSGTQYVFSSWSDGGAASHTITVGTSAAAYTASFNTQYQLTTSASPAAGGTVSPASGAYYNAGAVVNLSATPASGYAFSSWTGSVANASSASTTVTMTGPQTVLANFAASAATFTLDPTSANFSASAATGTVAVTASVSTAAWTAVSNTPSFLTVTSGASGTGNGTVGYSVAANTTGNSRTGTLTIAGQTFTVTQSAAATAGLGFVPVTPCRVVDTRNGNGGILGAASTRNFTIVGACAIPATAQAFSLNVTVVPAATLGYLSIWPTGQAQPNVSTLNSSNGAILANAAIVPAGTGGAVSVFVTDSTHVILDINGYFAPPTPSSLVFYPVTPCRVADTRTTQPLPAGGTRSFTVPSSACGIPATAQAYSLNMTAVPPGPLGYLTTWPTGQTQPNVSTLNALQGQIAANAAIVPAGTNGAISVYASDAANVIVDINGYFAPPGNAGALYFYPVTPCRIADTRNAAGDLGGPSLGAGATRTFPIPSSSCGLPSTAQAYSFNMTVVPSGSLLYLSTWPAGQPLPVVSTLNDVQAQIVANAAIVPAGASGAISVFVSDATNVIIDVNGYFGQ